MSATTDLASLLAACESWVNSGDAPTGFLDAVEALLTALRTPPSEEDWRGVMREHSSTCRTKGHPWRAWVGSSKFLHPLECGDCGLPPILHSPGPCNCAAGDHNARVTALRARVEAERERTRRVVEAAVAMIGDPDVMAWGDAGTTEAASTEVPQARWVELVDAVRALRGEP